MARPHNSLLSNPTMPIPPHQVFIVLSALNDLVAKFFRIDAHTTSKGRPESFEGVSG